MSEQFHAVGDSGVLHLRRTRTGLDQILKRPADMAGNFVVLQHRANEYSAYFHLKPGLAVRQGMSVRAGQPIGYCGNSGNSREPHLHWQLQDGPDPLRANGLPARFGGFTIYFGRLRLYVSADEPLALPHHLPIAMGRAVDADNYGTR